MAHTSLYNIYLACPVDDEREIVRAINLRLRANGYEVLTAHSGEEALNVAFASCPNLIILDIGMPHGDGYMVAQKLLANSMTQFIPIIFLTARTSVEDHELAYQAGTCRYLTKPCKAEDLLDTVERALSCVRPRRRAAATMPLS